MVAVEMILFLCFIFFQSVKLITYRILYINLKYHFQTLVASQISWENCDSDSNDIKLLNVTIKPYPIVVPGSISVEITIRNAQDITSPLKVGIFY